MAPRTIAIFSLAGILAAGSNVEAQTRSATVEDRALIGAVSSGDVREVHLLIEAGANLAARSDSGHTPLHMAAAFGQAEVARLLIKAGADLEARRNVGSHETPLHTAAAFGHVDVARLLIEAGANLEARNLDGHGPLIRAAQAGQTNTVQLLIERGAGIYFLALSEAAIYGHADVVRLLIGSVGVKARNKNGQTLLHMAAAQRGTVELVRLLVEAGVSLDAQDAEGDTALHIVAKQGEADVARLLVDVGADLNARNANGFTALRLAEHLGRIVVARVLRGQ